MTAPWRCLLSGQQSLGVHLLPGLDGQSGGMGRGADVLSLAIKFNVGHFLSILHQGHPLQTRGLSMGMEIHFHGHICMGKIPNHHGSGPRPSSWAVSNTRSGNRLSPTCWTRSCLPKQHGWVRAGSGHRSPLRPSGLP